MYFINVDFLKVHKYITSNKTDRAIYLGMHESGKYLQKYGRKVSVISLCIKYYVIGTTVTTFC